MRRVLLSVLLSATLFCCPAVRAETIQASGSWYIEITNYVEHFYPTLYVLPPENDGTRSGFYPGMSHSTTSLLNPVVNSTSDKLTFDFSSGPLTVGQDYARISPRVTVADDVVTRVSFDWKSYLGTAPSYRNIQLELWAGNNPYYQIEPYMVWSIRPGSGIKSGHLDMGVPSSLDYLTLRVSVLPVPEPSCLAMLGCGLTGLLGMKLRKTKA